MEKKNTHAFTKSWKSDDKASNEKKKHLSKPKVTI